jgi:hypothetical protein
MDKLIFEEYLNYRLSKYEHLLYWILMIIYITGFILTMLLTWKYFPVFQNYIFNKGDDIIFSLYSNGIFSISFFFLTLVFLWKIISLLFSNFNSVKNAILWYDVAAIKTYDYNNYKAKNKRNLVFMCIIVIIAFFFLSVSLFIHLRINNLGIYYNKIFEFRERHYGWNELKSVSIIPKVTHGKIKSLSPEMILEFGENRIDIWDGAGLGSPDSITLIRVLDLVKENTNIEFNVDNDFSDEILDLLFNNCTEWKKNNIINVFNYLDYK